MAGLPVMSAAINLRCLIVSPAAVASSLLLLPLLVLLLKQLLLTEVQQLLLTEVLTEVLSISNVAMGPVALPFAKNSVVRGSNEDPHASLDLNCYGQTNTNMRVFRILFSVSNDHR